MQLTRVEGRVAQVLDGRQLVINRGHADGVRIGMRFKIMAESPIQITDPDTGEILDEILREKLRVEVIEARERIAICATYQSRETRRRLGPDLDELRRPASTLPVTFRADKTLTLPPLDPEEIFLERGDRAVELIEPELE